MLILLPAPQNWEALKRNGNEIVLVLVLLYCVLGVLNRKLVLYLHMTWSAPSYLIHLSRCSDWLVLLYLNLLLCMLCSSLNRRKSCVGHFDITVPVVLR